MSTQQRVSTAGLVALLSLLVILLGACGGGNSGNTTSTRKAPLRQQVFVEPERGIQDLSTFDPALTFDVPSTTAIQMVFTGLVSLDKDLVVRPQLASSWTVSPNGLTWTFHLKPNLKFSDGTPLTSIDVAYSLDRALQPAQHSSTAPTYLGLIKDADRLVKGQIRTIIGDSVLTPDPQTVVILARQKATYFLNALTYPCSYVVEKKLIDKYGTKWTDHLQEGGGAGPFKVKEYTHNKRIVFVPNPQYYGPKPQLQQVIFPFYRETDTAYKAYQAGQVDFAIVPSQQVPRVRNQPEFHLIPQLWIRYYGMNYLVKPFDSINMRRAFALALNKDELAHAIWKDVPIPTNHIIPLGMPGYNPNLRGPDNTVNTRGNPQLASQYFQKGLQDEGLTSASQLPPITITYPSGNQDQANEIAAAIQMWQNVLGVTVRGEAIDFNKMLDELSNTTGNPHGLQMWAIGWVADYPDPQDWTTLQFDADSPYNQVNYGQNNASDRLQQQATQKLLEVADTLPDSNARLQAYQNAEQQLINDVAWLPITQVRSAYVLKPYVQGFVLNAQLQVPPDAWSQIYISVH
ncbi:peptide ABC transporter substrate-binding protein [Thermogemmatispora onikobensis]|uniref:peptide ABC transporter substrate-binding protein n=1 Tax=Thermogemmatispora onikobensis TaxID=732234 RepID=UPI000852E9D0|nr:peptide ABC transporter substrate-binding protein [Thermogemmatispora onikobensis]